MTLRLFVYGTLRSDLPARLVPPAASAARAMLRRQGRLEGPASLPGRLVVPAWYPGLVEDSPDASVRGQVWRLSGPAILSRLDWYEGQDYVRRMRRIRLERVAAHRAAVARITGSDSGRLQVAHVYLYVGEAGGLPVIPTGDFVDWLAKPRDPRDDRTP